MALNPDSLASSADTVDLKRREFFTQAGAAAGVAGALSAGLILPVAGAQAASAAGAAEFPKPKDLPPGAQSDSRYPVSFATPVKEGLRLVVDYFTALNQRDLRALARTLHFPFAIYEHIEPIVYQSEAEFLSNPPPSLNTTGKGRTRIAPRSYDMLEGVNVHLYCPVGGVFSLKFTRYLPGGHKQFDCDGIYSVTNNDGRWAIQLVSTIIHERGYEHHEYPDAEMTARLSSQGYLAAFGYRDEELLNDLSKGRGSYEPRLPAGTKIASVNFGYGPRERTRNARNNDPMRGWKAAGVKSRLIVHEVSEELGEQNTNLKEFVELAGGTVGEYDYTRINPLKPMVLHATHDKAHVLGGYTRFTTDHRFISETRSVGIRVRKAGQWGSSGNLGQVTHHDASNATG
jgi:hypothetical protein